jgi:DNA-binding CsgD family transcriptional regulator
MEPPVPEANADGPVERATELAAIRAATERVAGGAGGVILIEGAPGVGKTRLLDEASLVAGRRGIDVLTAAGGELEREIPFGVARQLFERRVSSAAPDTDVLVGETARLAAPLFEPVRLDRSAPLADTDVLAQALFWLTANLADQGPLALLVDDAHSADVASLRWLAYLSRRVADLPVLLAVAARRPFQPSPDLATVGEAATSGPGGVLRPRPLSPGGVATLLARELAEQPTEELADACMRATAGSPYLVRALAVQVRRAELSSAREVAQLAPETISKAAVRRLERLDTAAQTAARAVAVLGQEATLRRVALTAELGVEEAGAAIDSLISAEVLCPELPPAFVHPTILEAVVERLGAGEKNLLHTRAASALMEESAAPDSVAAHLLRVEPAGDSNVVEVLREAAALARRRGSPEAAATYLRRALGEPPRPDERLGVLEDLGRAESRYGDPATVEHLREAFELCEMPKDRARLAIRLGHTLTQEGRMDEAFAVFVDGQRELSDEHRDHMLELDAAALIAAMGGGAAPDDLGARLARVREASRGRTHSERVALATVAWAAAMAGEDRAETRRLAELSLTHGDYSDALSGNAPALYLAISALIALDAFEEAERSVQQALGQARARGSTLAYSLACGVATYLYQRWGRLDEAIALGDNALEIGRAGGVPFEMPVVPAFLAEAKLERGELEAAEAILERFDVEGPGGRNPAYDLLLHARGRLREARLDLDGALADFLLAGEHQEAWGARNPSLLPWRSSAARVAVRLGEADRGRELADEELERARRWGTARALGVALQAAGLARQGPEQIALLREAVEVLRDSPVKVELARAQLALGAATRRAGRDVKARELLRNALHGAATVRAAPLAQQAREELVAAGGRPRREAISGPDSLTPSERRIATAAAQGMTNREIAQQLFLSVKTIEMHLHNAYRKLNIESRGQLDLALDR